MLTKSQVDTIQSDLLAAETAIVNVYDDAISLATAEGASQGALARLNAAYTAIKVILEAGHKALTAASVDLGVTPDPAPSPLSGGGPK